MQFESHSTIRTVPTLVNYILRIIHMHSETLVVVALVVYVMCYVMCFVQNHDIDHF